MLPSQPSVRLQKPFGRLRSARGQARVKHPVAVAAAQGAVLQAEEEQISDTEAPLYTRITETPAKCPFAGANRFSTKDTDYQSWKVQILPDC